MSSPLKVSIPPTKDSFLAATFSSSSSYASVAFLSPRLLDGKHGASSLVSTIDYERIPKKRKDFYVSTHAIFLRLQQLKSNRKDVRVNPLLRNLKPFAAVIGAYRNHVWDYVQTLGPEDKVDILLFWNVHRCLHLFEIIFAPDSPAEFVVPKLVEWANFQSQDVANLLQKMKVIREAIIPSNHPDFWSVIHGLATRGKFLDLQHLLDKNESDGGDLPNSEMIVLRKIIKTAPSLKILKTSENDFSINWKLWQSEIKVAKERTTDARLKKLLQILSGDQAALKSQLDLWQDKLVFTLLHQMPTAQIPQIASYLEKLPCHDKSFDGFQQAVFKLDTYQCVRNAGEIDRWFLATVVDLLDSIDILKEELQEKTRGSDNLSLRDFIIINYATPICSDTNHWLVGAECLVSCGHVGKVVAQELLIHLPVDTEESLKKIILFGKTKSFSSYFAEDLYMSVAALMRSRKEYGEAMRLYIKAGDFCQVDQILEKILREYCKNGEAATPQILAKVEEFSDSNDHVHFLRSYVNMKQLLNMKQYRKAAENIIEMLVYSDLSLKKYWSLLLMDCLHIFKNTEEIVFSDDDTFDILRCAEDILTSFRSKEYLALISTTDGKDSMEIEDESKIITNFNALKLECAQNFFRHIQAPVLQ